jgi:hypothetical protein
LCGCLSRRAKLSGLEKLIMSLAQIVHGTPVWVWVLLVVLLSRGLKALNSHTASLARLAIVPLIFAGWGILHLLSNPLTGWSSVIVWVAGALVGIAAGVVIAKRSRFIVDPIAKTVMVPGSAVPLLLMIAAFASEFWVGVQLAVATSITALGMYTLIGATVSGIVAGVFAGRFITYWRAMNARRDTQVFPARQATE